ncbi:MAG: hypothetical protein ACREUF_06025, partial [Solimonas sp.]
LLDSYEQERRPIAEINTQQSLHNAARLIPLFAKATTALESGEVSLSTVQQIRDEIEANRDHFTSAGLQLGFSYGPPVHGPADSTRYDPSIEQGARLPHAWLEKGGRRLSILDMLDLGKFTLLAGPAGQAWRAWADASSDLRLVLLDDSIRFESDWPGMSTIAGTGAILARPDGHIAAVVRDDSTASQQSLSRTLRGYLIDLER